MDLNGRLYLHLVHGLAECEGNRNKKQPQEVDQKALRPSRHTCLHDRTPFQGQHFNCILPPGVITCLQGRQQERISAAPWLVELHERKQMQLVQPWTSPF